MIVRVHGKEIETTPEQPFYVDGKGWTAAQELEVGDLLISTDGKLTAVEELRFTSDKQPVYNMSITNDHTYFVGDANWNFSVWVHNTYLYRAGDGPNTSYIGISKNVPRRAREHFRKYGCRVKEIEGIGDVVHKKSRALEHLLIEKYGRKVNRSGTSLGGQLDNLNRGIDPRKLSQFTDELSWAKQLIELMDL